MSAEIIEFSEHRRRRADDGPTSLVAALLAHAEEHRAHARLLRSLVSQPSPPEPAEGADRQPSMLASVTPITSDSVVTARAILANGRDEFRAALQRLEEFEEQRLLRGTRAATVVVREGVE